MDTINFSINGVPHMVSVAEYSNHSLASYVREVAGLTGTKVETVDQLRHRVGKCHGYDGYIRVKSGLLILVRVKDLTFSKSVCNSVRVRCNRSSVDIIAVYDTYPAQRVPQCKQKRLGSH